MNLLSILQPLAKVVQIAQPKDNKPLHAGEIFYLWDGLTAGLENITVLETYLMSTEDNELMIILKGQIQVIMLNRVQKLENILKQEGFSVPPRPAPKTAQGKPGAGQDVKLSDDEIISNLLTWGGVVLKHDAEAVGACTRETVRKVFTDLLFDDMKGYSLLMELGSGRQVFKAPPPATAKDNSLNIDEVARVWDVLTTRHLNIINVETYLSNTSDQDLIKLLSRTLDKILIPQMVKLENVLKGEGFTAPPRPVRRSNQGPPGQVNRIKLNDNEIIRLMISSGQAAIYQHVNAYGTAIRKDISKLFEEFAATEIEEYQKLIQLASNRHALNNPPVVTSRRG